MSVIEIISVSLWITGTAVGVGFGALTSIAGEEKTSDTTKLLQQIRVYTICILAIAIGIGIKVFFDS